MAARINKSHSENTKGEIRASQLLNRLFSHANGECELTPTQVQAAKVFIAKYKADLKAIEHTGTIQHQHSLASTLAAIR